MNIRDQMTSFFQQPEIQQKIVNYLTRHNIDFENIDEDSLSKMMKQLNLLDQINHQVEQQIQLNEPTKDMNHSLSLTIHKGRKFKPLMDLGYKVQFYFVLAGFSQKVKSSSYSTAQNFTMNEKLTINMKTSWLKQDNNQNLQLLLVAVVNENTRILYSIKMIEWRFVLAYGSVSIDLEFALYNYEGINNPPSGGIISVTLNISSLPKHYFLAEASLNRQLQLEKKKKQSANNKFHAYASNFWNEIKNIHRSLQVRRIPIYCQTQDKLFSPLPKLIVPLYGVRGIDSPNHALRFCSLISFEEAPMNKEKMYRRFTSMLASGSGLIEDHCHLLCSLLLGFGLKAYVCIGTIGKGDHSWVISQSKDNSMIFWEVTKGVKMDYFSTKALTFYKSISAIYNHECYYANIQLDDSITSTKFNFKDQTQWKKMDEQMLEEIPTFNKRLSLAYPSINPYITQQNVQLALVKLIEQYRTSKKLNFAYDEILSSLLSTALTNYEIQRVTGTTFCEEEFQTAIKNYIPQKHTFKAFPIQLTTLNPKQIMDQLTQQPKSRQILSVKGQSIHFALRAKIVMFPDNIFALWLSVGVRYYKID